MIVHTKDVPHDKDIRTGVSEDLEPMTSTNSKGETNYGNRASASWLGRLPIAAKLIIPFVAISILTTALLGIGCFWDLYRSLSDSLESKSMILTRNLATELSDPLTMGETDRAQQILESARNYDHDMVCAIVTSSDGHVIARTAPTNDAMKDLLQHSNKDPQTVFKKSNSIRRSTSNATVFEVAMPVLAEFGPTWTVQAAFRLNDSTPACTRPNILPA